MRLVVLDWLSAISTGSPHIRVIAEKWIICTALIAATCLLGWCYKGFLHNRSRDKPRSAPPGLQPIPSHPISRTFNLPGIFARIRRRRQLNDPALDSKTPVTRAMRFTRQARLTKKLNTPLEVSPPPPPKTRQPYEAFLVLDVEATCQLGTDFNFPNEIIEFPVCLMKWKDRSDDHTASQLEVVDEFRTFVKPSWRPILSQFCTELTGISQEQVDAAPPFPAVIESFQKFMIKHGLLDADTGERLIRFCWCSDGPFDVRDFVVKQCFISKVPMPGWIQGDVLDVRTEVLNLLYAQMEPAKRIPEWSGQTRRSLNISAQLKALGLPAFAGREHSGIDDSRNIAKIVAELARRGICLRPNTTIYPNRRWRWMGKHGQVLDEKLEGYYVI